MKRGENLAIKLQIMVDYSYHKACDYVAKSFKPFRHKQV